MLFANAGNSAAVAAAAKRICDHIKGNGEERLLAIGRHQISAQTLRCETRTALASVGDNPFIGSKAFELSHLDSETILLTGLRQTATPNDVAPGHR